VPDDRNNEAPDESGAARLRVSMKVPGAGQPVFRSVANWGLTCGRPT